LLHRLKVSAGATGSVLVSLRGNLVYVPIIQNPGGIMKYVNQSHADDDKEQKMWYLVIYLSADYRTERSII
jgi:hypothetical protein